VHTTLYGPCTRPCTGRVLYTVVYTGHVHTRPVYTAVYTVVYTCTRPSNGRIHGPYTAVYLILSYLNGRVHGPCTWSVHGRVHGLYMAEYTVVCTSTRPVHETYRILDFLTNCCNYVREQNKASFCLYRKFIKHGVKRGSGIKILYLLTGPIPCPTNVSDRLD